MTRFLICFLAMIVLSGLSSGSSLAQSRTGFREFDSKMVHSPAELLTDLYRLLEENEKSNPLKGVDLEAVKRVNEIGREYFKNLSEEEQEKVRKVAEQFIQNKGLDSSGGIDLDQFGISKEDQKELVDQFKDLRNADLDKFRDIISRQMEGRTGDSSQSSRKNRSFGSGKAKPGDRNGEKRSGGFSSGDFNSSEGVGENGNSKNGVSRNDLGKGDFGQLETGGSLREPGPQTQKENQRKGAGTRIGNLIKQFESQWNPNKNKDAPGSLDRNFGGATANRSTDLMEDGVPERNRADNRLNQNPLEQPGGSGFRPLPDPAAKAGAVGDAKGKNGNLNPPDFSGTGSKMSDPGAGGPKDALNKPDLETYRKLVDRAINSRSPADIETAKKYRDELEKSLSRDQSRTEAGKLGSTRPVDFVDPSVGDTFEGAGRNRPKTEDQVPSFGEREGFEAYVLKGIVENKLGEFQSSKETSDFEKQSNIDALRRMFGGIGSDIKKRLSEGSEDDKSGSEIFKEFKRAVVDAATEVEAAERIESVGGDESKGALDRLKDGLFDSVGDTVKKKREEAKQRRAKKRAERAKAIAAGNGGVGTNPKNWNSNGGGFGGGGGGGAASTSAPLENMIPDMPELPSIPEVSFSTVMTYLVIFCLIVLMLYFLVNNFVLDDATPSGERRFGKSFGAAKIRSPKDLVDAVDYFIVQKFGQGSRWWNAKHAQDVLCTATPHHSSMISDLLKDYVRARYTRTDSALPVGEQQRYKSVLQELAKEVKVDSLLKAEASQDSVLTSERSEPANEVTQAFESSKVE